MSSLSSIPRPASLCPEKRSVASPISVENFLVAGSRVSVAACNTLRYCLPLSSTLDWEGVEGGAWRLKEGRYKEIEGHPVMDWKCVEGLKGVAIQAKGVTRYSKGSVMTF